MVGRKRNPPLSVARERKSKDAQRSITLYGHATHLFFACQLANEVGDMRLCVLAR